MFDDNDVLKGFSPGSYMNPHNPLDPSTPYGREQMNNSFEDFGGPTGVMTGWRRIVFIGCILAFMLMPLYLKF